MTKTELKEIMLKIQNECALEEPSKITYFWNENNKVVFKFYFDSLYLPDDLNLSDEKKSERIKNLFTNQNVYEFQDDFNIIELNTEEGWIKVIPTDQNFKVVDSYKDLKKKKEDDEKEESVVLAGKRLNENVALAEGMILREGGTNDHSDLIQADGLNTSQEEQNKDAKSQSKNSTEKKTTVLKGKSIFICTVGNPFGKSIEILSQAFEANKAQTSFDTLIVIPTYGKEFGIAKGGDFGFKESVREALRKKIFDQNWGLNIFSLEHQESREILKQSSKNDGDDVLFFCAKSQLQEIQSILGNDYKINLPDLFDIEEDDKKVKVDNKKEDQNQSEDNKEDQSKEGKEEKKDAGVANENLVEKLKELPAVLSADYIEGKGNIAINIVEAFMSDVEKIKEAAEKDSKKPNKKNNDNKNKPNETGKNDEQNDEQADKTNSTENSTVTKGQPADGKGNATGTAEVSADASASKPAAINASIFLSPYRIHRKLVEKKQSEAYKLETNADWDYYFNKLLGEKWVTAKKAYTKSYQSIPQNVDSEEFKTYFYLGMIAYAYATSNKVLELDKPYIKNEKSMEQQLINNPKPKNQANSQRDREPGSEDLKLNLDIGFGTEELSNEKGGGGLIVSNSNSGGSGQVRTKGIKAPDLSVKTGKDNITSKDDTEAPKSFPGAALPFNLKIWALVDNQNINEADLEKLKKPKLSK